MTAFTFADAIVGLVLLISAGMAFLRGFVHEVLAIGAWAGAALATLYGFDYVQPWCAAQIGSGLIANLIAGAGLFLACLLILSLLTNAISRQVRKSALNSVDSSLGFVFGLLRGALLLSAAYYSADQWVFDQGQMPEWLSTAKTRPWLERGEAQIKKFRPHNLDGNNLDNAPPALNSASGDLIEDSRRGQIQLGEIPRATVESLATPKPQGLPQTGGPGAKTKGYDKDERREMDRLINNTQ